MTARNPSRPKWLESFIPHRLEMLRSPAWLAVPAPLHRMLGRIEVEHLSHGGTENGNLFVPYSQFVDCGISRRQIRSLAELGEALGLMECRKDPGLSNGRTRPPNAYRLTYVPEKGKKAPTDEWRSISKDRAKLLVGRFRAAEERSRRGGEEAGDQVEEVIA